MEIRQGVTQLDVAVQQTSYLRDRLVVSSLFKVNKVTYVQSHHDRILLGGCALRGGSLLLEAPENFGANTLLTRRELGLVCLSGSVSIEVDQSSFKLDAEDIIYISQGTQRIHISGTGDIYFSSSICHYPNPTTLVRKSEAETIVIGDRAHSNERTLRKYIHENGAASSTMAMGITTIHEGSVWNTMPCHIHERRTEAYLYFDIPENEKVIHLMGESNQTRNIILDNKEAIISPAWSIHTGAGTSNYKFVWSTAGENVTYTDFVPVPTSSLT
jgi:4-deoxy-L-threo-5-hexosulose-uronate ketol-isomerase